MSSERPVDALRRARERTLAAGSARIALSTEYTWSLPALPRRRRGGVLRPVLNVAKAAGKRAWRLAARSAHRLEAEGVLDLRGRRFMLDYGSYARLSAGGRQWSGRSGQLLSTLPSDRDVLDGAPLWLLDLLAGAVDARDEGSNDVRGTRCRHLAVTADMSVASRATPGGLTIRTAIGTSATFEDLLALAVAVWLDDAHIRRVRFASEHSTETLELWDFGTPVDDLDWTRLPTSRSPKEAARVARARSSG